MQTYSNSFSVSCHASLFFVAVEVSAQFNSQAVSVVSFSEIMFGSSFLSASHGIAEWI